MNYFIRCIISHKAMWMLGLRPCDMERAFPGSNSGRESVASIPITPATKPTVEIGKWNLISGNIAQQTPQQLPKKEMTGAESLATSNPIRLQKAVKQAVQLESEDNMDCLWKYFALVVDRLFFILNIMITVVVLVEVFK